MKPHSKYVTPIPTLMIYIPEEAKSVFIGSLGWELWNNIKPDNKKQS